VTIDANFFGALANTRVSAGPRDRDGADGVAAADEFKPGAATSARRRSPARSTAAPSDLTANRTNLIGIK
jgi:hypothetical protein